MKIAVPAGYYLIKDKDDSLGQTYDAYTTYVVLVAGDVKVTPKAVKPTVDKQVWDEQKDAETGAADGWGESADHAINEKFKFKLTANLPKSENYEAYTKYTVRFRDTMSDGITFDAIESVKVGDITLNSTDYKTDVSEGQNGGNWYLEIEDLKTIAGVNLGQQDVKVEVIYVAHLNEKATVNKTDGATDNKNTVYLEYSNNPNVLGEGEFGETPDDSVWVFTYRVENKKVDEKGKVLPNVGFRLYEADGTTEIGLIYDSSLGAYRLCKNGETPVEMKSAENTGKFDIVGLDAGTYILKETTTPQGYNTCQPITIRIEAVHKEEVTGDSANTTFVKTSQGIDNTIENRKGSSLPSTGGIGTTIFYVVGGILMAGAAILLITKKKMSNK